MKKLVLVTFAAILLAVTASGRSKPASGQSNPASGQSKQSDLERVLTLLDRTSPTIHTVQTDFVWDQYQKVVEEHDIQKGVMYFKRSGAAVDAAADITDPFPGKKLLLKNGKVQVYIRKTGQTTDYDARKNRESVESFMVLGFGGRGHELTKSFDVRYAGMETIDGVATYKLELTPKLQQVRNMFPLITLWIDQNRGVSVQQKLNQGEGDYRVAKFTNIEINPRKLPDDAFKLKTE